MEARKPPTGFIVDQSTNTIKPIFDPFPQEDIDQLVNERLNICKKCDNYLEENPTRSICKLCGCSLIFKVRLVYPFDQDGKAFNLIYPEGKRSYICRLKKW